MQKNVIFYNIYKYVMTMTVEEKLGSVVVSS